MSDLIYKEKSLLERLFEMGGGFVLDFSDRTFREFINDAVEIDISQDKYNYRSGSKANRLRGFWDVESNYITGKLLESLLDYWITQVRTTDRRINNTEEMLYEECTKIVSRLLESAPVENVSSIQPNVDDKDFLKLAKSIRESIEKNEPETALDRLHTFTIKYIRELCNKHGIKFDPETPLHSLFGAYVKHLASSGLLESSMTERILKSSISILESFNDVRNNKSFAHDNKILNYHESILIFSNVSSAIKFIDSIENKTTTDTIKGEKVEKPVDINDELPF